MPGFARILPWACGILSALLGCSNQGGVSRSQSLPPGAVAIVGSSLLGRDVLERARAGRAPREAMTLLLADARLALEASALYPDRAAAIERGLLTRALVESMRRQALAQAAPRPDELATLAQSLWMEIDRPRCVRTINIMAQVPPLADGAREERVLGRIAELVSGAGTIDELTRRLQGFDSEGANVVTLMAPPLTADGRVCAETAGDQGLPVPPPEYAAAAARLTHVGDTSPVVSTSVGYHVLMVQDILPPLALSPLERTRRLERAVADRRIDAELQRLRAGSTGSAVWRNPQQAALTSLVWRAMSGP